ncbi:LysM peptidoglycan-binding domain-containing protein [Flavobacterium sp. RNTU_13]|uniref:LysM peptidoglycan-binding domain-containing protein n=1 Tax=Flavobacterium sp. RNTU_13 TaxID=3375145 RepID=UPI003987048F
MKMRVLCFWVFFGSVGAVFSQQNNQSSGNDTIANSVVGHRVEMGETVMLIARKYHITPDDIYELNPDAVHGITFNTVLQLPADKVRAKAVEKKHSTASAYANTAKPKGF